MSISSPPPPPPPPLSLSLSLSLSPPPPPPPPPLPPPSSSSTSPYFYSFFNRNAVFTGMSQLLGKEAVTEPVVVTGTFAIGATRSSVCTSRLGRRDSINTLADVQDSGVIRLCCARH